MRAKSKCLCGMLFRGLCNSGTLL